MLKELALVAAVPTIVAVGLGGAALLDIGQFSDDVETQYRYLTNRYITPEDGARWWETHSAFRIPPCELPELVALPDSPSATFGVWVPCLKLEEVD